MGNNRAVFYFDVEVKRRELLSRLTLAALLAERGCHVFIGERATLESIRKIIPRATVVRKSVRYNSIDILKELKGSGCKIINIEEEGETTVSARKMSELCRSLPDAENVEFTLKDGKLTVSSKNFHGDFATISADDFPELEVNEDQETT